jgi:hypothetical protein
MTWNQIIYIIISVNVCLFVCTAIDSAPGSATILRPISLEPVWTEGVQREKKFPEKWPVAELPKLKVLPLMLFYGKNLFSTELMNNEWVLISKNFYQSGHFYRNDYFYWNDHFYW